MYVCCAVAETSAAMATVTATAAATEDSYDDVLVAYIEILKLCVCVCVWMLIDFNMPQLNLICTQNNLSHARQCRRVFL